MKTSQRSKIIILIKLEEINQKVLAKEGRLKRHRQRVKQYRQNRTFQNNERKSYQQVEDDRKTSQQPDAGETDQLPPPKKKHNEKAEWINNKTKVLEGLEEMPKAETHINLLKKTLKNIKLENTKPWWNTWFLVQEIHLHSRQTNTRNEQIPTRSTYTRMDDQRKDHIDPKGSKQRNSPKQLQNQNMPTNNVENINSINKGRNLLLATKPRIIPWGTKRMPQRIQRHSRVTLHRSAHPKREQDQMEKSSLIDYKKA